MCQGTFFTSENDDFSMGEYRRVPAEVKSGDVVQHIFGNSLPGYVFFTLSILHPPRRRLREMIPTGPAGGSDSLFFEVLQDSRAKMQDSKGIFGVF